MIFLSALLLSMFITVVLVPILAKAADRYNVLDLPDDRKVHTHPVPRIGGMAMALGVLLPIFFLNHLDRFAASVLIGCGIIVFFGILDDFGGLSYKLKFLGQIAAAGVVIVMGRLNICHMGNCLPEGVLLPDWVAIPLSFLAIVAVTNAINLADGLDGLAGGMMLIAFICIGYLGYRSGDFFVSITSFAMAGAILGFLRFNTYPASVFMGDTGSQLMGFLAITLSLGITQGNTALSPLLPLLLLGFPILDTAVVMVERIHRGDSPFMPDKNHFHHKLIRMGFFHSEAVFTIYVIQAFFVCSAYFLRFYSEWFLIGYYLVSVSVILIPFYVAEKAGFRFQRTGYLDTVIKKRLKVHVKEKNLVIIISQGMVEMGLPLLFLSACLVPKTLPTAVSVASAVLMAALFSARLFKPDWLAPLLRVLFYLLAPSVLFLGGISQSEWISHTAMWMYNILFLAIAFSVMLVLKFTRRRMGFRVTATDFLILFIALVVPNLPDENIQSLQLGFLAIRLIIFFFGIEVLIGELRGQLKRFAFSMLPALGVLVARGLL